MLSNWLLLITVDFTELFPNCCKLCSKVRWEVQKFILNHIHKPFVNNTFDSSETLFTIQLIWMSIYKINVLNYFLNEWYDHFTNNIISMNFTYQYLILKSLIELPINCRFRGRVHIHVATLSVKLTLTFKPTHPPSLTSSVAVFF